MMKGVVEQVSRWTAMLKSYAKCLHLTILYFHLIKTEFFQRDNYLLLNSIRRSLVSLVEAMYSEKGHDIRAGVIKYFEESGRNQFTRDDVKIIVMLESGE